MYFSSISSSESVAYPALSPLKIKPVLTSYMQRKVNVGPDQPIFTAKLSNIPHDYEEKTIID